MIKIATRLVVISIIFVAIPGLSYLSHHSITHSATGPAGLASRFNHCWRGIAGNPNYVIYHYSGNSNWKIGGKAKVDEAVNSMLSPFTGRISVYAYCDRYR